MSAYVPGFENDLFFSYAHAEEPVWIQTFVKSLSDRLLSHHGIKVSIWQDKSQLRVGENWQNEIEEGIKKSAVFLAVVSPNYRDSEWCTRERRIFQQLFAPGEFEKSCRFFKIVKIPWENDGHRGFWAAIQDLELFRREDGPGGIEEFSLGSNEFQSSIRILANSVERTLRRMRRERERVFVASPVEECQKVWKELREELHAKGYDVQPEGLRDAGFGDELIHSELEDALLSVHLLGRVYDPFVQRQVQMAADLEQKLIFWLESGAEATVEPEQARLLATLRNGQRPDRPGIALPHGWEFLPPLTPRGLMEAVMEALKPKPPQILTPQPLIGEVPRVYIVHDATTEEDAQIAASLQNEIREQEKMEVFVSRADLPSPAELQLRHRMLLQTCEGVLLCRKSAPEEWLVQTAPEVLLADQLLRRREPLKSKAFLVPDPDPWSEWPRLKVIPYTPLFRTGDLEPFLEPLRNGGAHGR